MMGGISVIGFFIGLAGVASGMVLGIILGITCLVTDKEYPVWKKIVQWLLGGGAILTIVSFGTCLLTFKM